MVRKEPRTNYLNQSYISPGEVRGIWNRQDLETFKKRLKTLEACVAEDGIILTEAQLAAMERAKEEEVLKVK